MRDYLLCLGVGLCLAFAVLTIDSVWSSIGPAQTRGVVGGGAAHFAADRLW